MRPRLLFWVQHLLGIGHLMRAATLARAFEAYGFAVTLVSGGMPVPGFAPGVSRFVQLPPTRATDRYFKVLVDERDERVDEAWKAMRLERLLAVLAETRPDVLLAELYPFGRRQMRFEVEPLLAAAHAMPVRPLVVSSVRDILVEPDKPERIDEMVARLRRFFDLVLVHGDAAFIPFETTFPRLAEIADMARYTGYVVDPPPPREGPGAPGWGEVIVSTGGGAVGSELIEAALAARPLTILASAPWRLLAGHNLPAERFAALVADAPPGVVVERARPDFRRFVANCRLTVSQGGYNTVMEV
ncbi:MAG: glycosyl transferase family 28, partial [Alphaproteobacteria bacterium]|nr:glycosyl transferase family 28 [Alphaproteobacteria bacterium]